MADIKKIKILRIINRFNIGGPVYNAILLSAFMPEEYDTLLIGGLPEKNEENSTYIAEKYGVNPLLISEMQREPNFKNDRKALKKIKEIILSYRPDIVHTHASKAGALAEKLPLTVRFLLWFTRITDMYFIPISIGGKQHYFKRLRSD
jgi:hypothetical protein